MTLWLLLILICFVMPIAGALTSAELARVGFGGYALAIVIGLAVGTGCAWTMWTVGGIAVARTKRHSVSLQEWCARAAYFAAVLWIVVAGLLGGWVSSLLLRLVF
jgi:hypothetical protein